MTFKNQKETLRAINKLIEKNAKYVNCKRIRQCNNIKASDRSKINFIWRSLKVLEQEDILIPNGGVKPKNYIITTIEQINVEHFIASIERKR